MRTDAGIRSAGAPSWKFSAVWLKGNLSELLAGSGTSVHRFVPETGQLCLDRNLIVISVLSVGREKGPSFHTLVRLAPAPLTAVADGAGRVREELDLLKEVRVR